MLNGDGFSVDSVVYFVCVDDHDLLGSSAVLCMINGEWLGTPPTCTLRNSEQ